MARLRPFPPLPSLPLSLSSLSPLIGLMDGVCRNFGLTAPPLPPLPRPSHASFCIITHEHTVGFLFLLFVVQSSNVPCIHFNSFWGPANKSKNVHASTYAMVGHVIGWASA